MTSVFAIEEQDPNEIEFFEFTVPGVYERKTDESGEPVERDGKPVYTGKLETHRLPMMQYLGVELVERMERGGVADVLAVFGGNAGAIRRLNGKQLGGLMAAWRNASAVGLGESGLSTGSSESTDEH